MSFDRSRTSDRITSAAGALAIQALLAWLLIAGLAVTTPGAVRDELKLFAIGAEPPPPPPEKVAPRPAQHHAAQGAASPPNLKATPTDLVAPTLPPIIPPPLLAAPKAGTGNAPSAGASTMAGPGTGSGGQGNGSGNGDEGDGDGDGGTDARPLSHIRDSDYPRAAWDAGIGGTVVTGLTVGANGRVSGCKVIETSGHAELDAATCPLILKRFRFDPARDARGKRIAQYVEDEQVWDPTRR
ncbi:MAG: energy transducer TonB [Sphingomonas sp.]